MARIISVQVTERPEVRVASGDSVESTIAAMIRDIIGRVEPGTKPIDVTFFNADHPDHDGLLPVAGRVYLKLGDD